MRTPGEVTEHVFIAFNDGAEGWMKRCHDCGRPYSDACHHGPATEQEQTHALLRALHGEE